MDGPSEATIADLAANLGIELDEQELADVTAIVGATLADIGRLDELAEPSGERRDDDPAERSGYRPSDDEDPHGAWLRKCHVTGAEDGPLSGTRVGLKDTISLAGIEMAIGSGTMDGYLPSDDATIVTRLLDAGATIVGKNTMIGIGGYEPPMNPTAPEYSIGGSTSGGAAAVAAGEVDVAIGGDQAGSIRIPASYAGLVGVKPTYGLLPYTGIFGHGTAIDHTGPIARTVTDAAIATEVMAGRDGLDTRQPRVLPEARYTEALVDDLSGVTVGVLREGFERPEAEADVTATVRRAVDELASLGATVLDVSVPLVEEGLTISFPINLLGLGKTMKQGGVPFGFDGWFDAERVQFTDRVVRDGWEGVSRSFQVRALVADYLERSNRNAVYAKAKNLALAARRDLDETLRDVDALALPTSPTKPRRSDAERGVDWQREHGVLVPSAVNTGLFNVTHHPAMTVPSGRTDGAPVGMMLVGERFDEASLFRIAYAYEQNTDHGVAG